MLLKEKKPRFKEMLENGEMVFAPCVWDCYSAKAAEICGFKAVLLAGTPAAAALTGTPDIALMSADELIYLTDRIATFSPLPVIVDFDEGYGDSPINTYRNITRLLRQEPRALRLMTEWESGAGQDWLLQNRESALMSL